MDQITFYALVIGFLILFGYLIYKFLSKPRFSESQQTINKKFNNAASRDPVLHYEVTKGKFGDSSRQSLSFSGKKARWK
jgi:hypothetical protein